jgi:type I restriction enzyme M protein
MPKAGAKKSSPKNNGSAPGFEATLWATADKLRGNLDAAEYKHVVLGLIFLKYISDDFEEHHAALRAALLPKLLSGGLRVPIGQD